MGTVEDLFARVPKTATRIYSPPDPCPCESGSSVASCPCLPNGIADAQTHANLVAGYQHAKCYARHLGDCSHALSGEHYLVPKQILKKGGKSTVVVTGQAWQREPVHVQTIGINSLAANVLCRAHNSRLHALDDQFSRFYDHVRFSAKYLASGEPKEFLFNGHDIERWMLKAICGWLAARGNAEISERWIELLFGIRPMPENRGLFFRVTGLDNPPRDLTHPGVPDDLARTGISFQPLGTSQRNPVIGAPYVTAYTGCEIGFCGLRMTLSMTGRSAIRLEQREPKPIWRPREIRWYQENDPTVFSIRFQWPKGGGSSILGMRTKLERGPSKSG